MQKLACLLLLLLATTVTAEDKVYRYVDANGVIHYTDKPPSKGAKPVKLPKLQTFSGGTGAPAPAPDASPLPVAPQFSLAINSPTPDQTFRGTGTTVNVTVSILPALVSGYGLIYYLDGTPQNDTPITQTSHTLSGLERGSHDITVALVGPKGEEVARSSVTVYMKQPIAKHNN